MMTKGMWGKDIHQRALHSIEGKKSVHEVKEGRQNHSLISLPHGRHERHKKTCNGMEWKWWREGRDGMTWQRRAPKESHTGYMMMMYDTLQNCTLLHSHKWNTRKKNKKKKKKDEIKASKTHISFHEEHKTLIWQKLDNDCSSRHIDKWMFFLWDPQKSEGGKKRTSLFSVCGSLSYLPREEHYCLLPQVTYNFTSIPRRGCKQSFESETVKKAQDLKVFWKKRKTTVNSQQRKRLRVRSGVVYLADGLQRNKRTERRKKGHMSTLYSLSFFTALPFLSFYTFCYFCIQDREHFRGWFVVTVFLTFEQRVSVYVGFGWFSFRFVWQRRKIKCKRHPEEPKKNRCRMRVKMDKIEKRKREKLEKRKTSQQKEEETVKKTKYKAYLNVFHGLWLSWPES